MKRSIGFLTLITVATTSAFAQAPASIAGQTLRADFVIDTGVLPVEQLAAIDFFPDGTFNAYFLASGLLPNTRLQYGTPVKGTYTYTVTAPNLAALTFNPSLASIYGLNFSSGTEGTVDTMSFTRFSPSFALRPTGVIPSSRALVNMSVLISVSRGSPVSFGFIVGGTTKLREILIRAVGPTLAQFGISNYALNPVYKLNGSYGQSNGLMPGETSGSGVQYDPFQAGAAWSTSTASSTILSAEGVRAGAFSLLPNSNDKADIYLLSPGAYTVSVAPFDSSQEGTVLIEVYEVE